MNFVGDVFTSLVKPIVDLTYSVCFFATGDFLQHLGEPGICEDKEGLWAKFSEFFNGGSDSLFYLSVYLVLLTFYYSLPCSRTRYYPWALLVQIHAVYSSLF